MTASHFRSRKNEIIKDSGMDRRRIDPFGQFFALGTSRRVCWLCDLWTSSRYGKLPILDGRHPSIPGLRLRRHAGHTAHADHYPPRCSSTRALQLSSFVDSDPFPSPICFIAGFRGEMVISSIRLPWQPGTAIFDDRFDLHPAWFGATMREGNHAVPGKSIRHTLKYSVE